MVPTKAGAVPRSSGRPDQAGVCCIPSTAIRSRAVSASNAASPPGGVSLREGFELGQALLALERIDACRLAASGVRDPGGRRGSEKPTARGSLRGSCNRA